jgi:hypothetical protein
MTDYDGSASLLGLLGSPKVVHLSHYPIGLARNSFGIYLRSLKLLGLKLLRLLLSSDCSLRNLPSSSIYSTLIG